mmetsp:Transcript_21340/g.20500  ORF Transcript_21340/g.20500 Transcript_21340/m.20500 type:complete len:428 (-) Transcript_21340:295-1578(-)
MKSTIASLVIAAAATQYVGAFTPAAFRRPVGVVPQSSSTSMRMTDPSSFIQDLPHHVNTLSNIDNQAIFSSFTSLADDLVADVAEVAATDSGNGWFGFLAGPIEGVLDIIHTAFVGVGISANAWGASILSITIIIKLLTFPLTKAQMESTMKMQALQPSIKEIQAKYTSNPEVMNQKISEFYQTNEVNPLAGCIPSIVQLPVFIGLYRGVLSLAKENRLDESFLWLPSLEGPTYGADPAHASDWIMKGWVDGVPSLGWHDSLLFLSLPVILIASQFASMAITSPKVEGVDQPAFLKFLPLLIGYFSLNVPAALGIYWVANNIITTALTVVIKSGLSTDPVTPVTSGGGAVLDATPTTFTPAPMKKKPDGFGASVFDEDTDGVKPITPMEAEVVAKDFSGEEDSSGGGSAPQRTNKKRGGKKKKKRRN